MNRTTWNSLSPADREKAIMAINSTNGTSFGLSNAKCSFDKVSKSLRDMLSIVKDATDTAEAIVASVETEHEASVEEFTGLDLLISFDDTGSMSSVKKLVRNNVNDLVGNLLKTIPGLRVGIIIHNDYCDHPHHIFSMDFTDNFPSIERFVSQDTPGYGGDSDENYEQVLHEAAKLNWQNSRKAMLVIGDALPHEPGYTNSGCQAIFGGPLKLNWRNEARTLAKMGVQIYGIQALGWRGSSSFYQKISEISNGVKLDLSQFQHIHDYIRAIAFHQQGTLDTFKESNPQFKTNFALKSMFSKLQGGTLDAGFAEKIELLSKFQVMDVDTDGEMSIRDFVENNGATFKKGKGYYSLVSRTADGKANREIIQADKEVIFVDKATGECFSDTRWCREQLGVPYGTKDTVKPLQIPEVMDKYDVFIQSNSYNRKLDSGTKFLYELDHV